MKIIEQLFDVSGYTDGNTPIHSLFHKNPHAYYEIILKPKGEYQDQDASKLEKAIGEICLIEFRRSILLDIHLQLKRKMLKEYSPADYTYKFYEGFFSDDEYGEILNNNLAISDEMKHKALLRSKRIINDNIQSRRDAEIIDAILEYGGGTQFYNTVKAAFRSRYSDYDPITGNDYCKF